MNIIEVIPITKTSIGNTLSYFTSKDIHIGAIVNIPLRNKIIYGIVNSIKNASEMKAEIKSADFSLKKIEKVKSTNFFSEAFIKMTNEVAEYYATNIGSILSILAPNYILNNVNKLIGIKNNTKINEKDTIIREKYAIQGNDEERYSNWKSLIRQEFAKKKSIFFLMPTIEDGERALEILEKGVEGYVFLLHGSLNPKKIIEIWNKVMSEEHPIVIISTGSFLSIPRDDIQTLIIEKENSKAYKVPRRPFLDIRYIAEILAEKRNIKVFFADNLLRIETLWRESQNQIIQASPFKFRSLSTAIHTLIDMRENKVINSNFKILSEEVEKLILKTKNDSEQMIILATRRGIAPTTVCGDCQNIVICNKCSSPVVLHKSTDKDNDKSFFLCHHCGDRRSTEEYCKVCGSWKLGIIGIGIDLVIQKIKDKFPDTLIFQIDSDTVKTEKAIKNIIQKFKSKPGGILIGTEMMLPYIHEKVDNSAIISLDSLFALPDFRIQEKILYMLIHIRSLTNKNFIVQTRKSDEKVFEYGLKGNMSDFYREAIEERKKYNYPPFSTLIKITLEGKKDKIIKEMEEAQNILDPYEVEVFPAFTQTIKGNYVLHGLIRLQNNKWPDNNLIEKIRLLSLNIIVKVDPETLL